MSRQTRKFIDLDMAFAAHPTTYDLSKKYDVSAIKQSVKNLVFTNFYERLFHPEVGSNVTALLFEPFSPLTRGMLIKSIQDTILNFEPRVQLIDVVIKENIDENDLVASIVFRIVNTSEPQTLDLMLKRTR